MNNSRTSATQDDLQCYITLFLFGSCTKQMGSFQTCYRYTAIKLHHCVAMGPSPAATAIMSPRFLSVCVFPPKINILQLSN